MSKKQCVVVSHEDGLVGYKIEGVEEYQSNRGERFLTHGFLMDSFRKLMGKTLTIIDASVVEKQQNKAVKDLLRRVFSDEMEFAGGFAYDQKEMDKILDEVDPKDIGKPVSIEEALGVEA